MRVVALAVGFVKLFDDRARGATLSMDNRYRYLLWRGWDDRPRLGFVMLNPSTADADIDDQTIRQCCKYARRDGYGGIVVANLFAFRTKDPLILRDAHRAGVDVAGPANDGYIQTLAVDQAIADVVCAWGVLPGWANDRLAVVDRILAEHRERLLSFGVTQGGHPKHPARLAGELPLLEFVP